MDEESFDGRRGDPLSDRPSILVGARLEYFGLTRYRYYRSMINHLTGGPPAHPHFLPTSLRIPKHTTKLTLTLASMCKGMNVLYYSRVA